jgi:predicted DNA-binding transcriptional regulator AlpA
MANEINLNEVCKILGKSKRTITRYIKAGKLNPKQVKNEKGILEYSFDRSEIEKLKNPEASGQTTGQNQKTEKKDDDILSVIKVFEKQLKAKDQQIKQLLERQRETNYLLKGLQDKVLLLEDKTKDKKHRTEDTTKDTTPDKIKGFFDRLFKRGGQN